MDKPAVYHQLQRQFTDTELTIGNNPVLPLLLNHTWGWPAVYLTFRLKGEVVGLFMASFTGKEWFSFPHFSHAGFSVNKARIVELAQTALDHRRLMFSLRHIFSGVLKEIDKPEGILHLEYMLTDTILSSINSKDPGPDVLSSRDVFPLVTGQEFFKTLSILGLEKEVALQLKGFSTAVRRKIRKAAKNGIDIRMGGAELLPDFYRVYRRGIHRLGSLGLPRKFFDRLLKDYGFGTVRVAVASLNGKPCGAGILLTYGSFAENPWFASDSTGNHHYVTYLLHQAFIEEAIKEGCSVYSFGRSTRGGPVEKYKHQWGCQEIPLYYNSLGQGAAIKGKTRLLQTLIRMLPQELAMWLDEPVARRIY